MKLQKLDKELIVGMACGFAILVLFALCKSYLWPAVTPGYSSNITLRKTYVQEIWTAKDLNAHFNDDSTFFSARYHIVYPRPRAPAEAMRSPPFPKRVKVRQR